jgi:hypothetical protein
MSTACSQTSLHGEVDSTTEDHSKPAVDPKQYTHGLTQPWPSLGIIRAILGNVDENSAKTDQPGRYK